MKIEQKQDKKAEVSFGSLAGGGAFLYKDDLYMKLRAQVGTVANAVCLRDGSWTWFGRPTIIVPVDATVTYKLL